MRGYASPRHAALLAALLGLGGCGGGDPDARMRVTGAALVEQPPQLALALSQPFGPTVLEALHSGIPLRYEWNLELFGPGGERLARRQGRFEVAYRSFTRWYTLSGISGADPVALPTIADTERVLADLALPLGELDATTVDRARVRVALDVGALPPPLRLPAYLSREWRRDSGWHAWSTGAQAYD